MFDRTRFPFTLQNKSRRLVVFQDHFVSWAVTLYLGLGASHITTAQDAWTYSTPQLPEIPAVIHTSSIQNDIDAFILRKLEAHSLALADRADKGTLIRRLYLDLIGIPPSREEMKTVLSDESPDAISRLIDQLLDDPRYGEHWARDWLDLARYADTAGYEGDPDLPHAWRYRDYVIDSFNRDKPYSQFIREQIAGDELQEILGAGELPEPPAENLIALTFLRLAPFTEPRGDETRHELLSEITGTVSSVFLGLTVGCAQCHDHMYDPIPTEDFYRLKAFFSTIQIPPPRRGDIYQLGGPTPANFYLEGQADRIQQRRERLVKEAATATEKLGQLKAEWIQQLGLVSGFGIQALGGSLGNDYVFDRRQVTDGRVHRTVVTSDGQQWQYTTDNIASTDQGSLAGSNRGHWFGGLDQPDYLSLGAATNGHAKPEAAFFHGQLSHLLIFSKPLDAQQLKLSPQELGQLPSLCFWLDASDLDANPETPNPKSGEPVDAWTDKVSGLVFRPLSEDQTPQVSHIGEASSPAVEFGNDFLLAPASKLPWLEDEQGTIVTVFTSTNEQEAYLFEAGGAGQFIATFVNPAAGQGDDLLEKLINDADDTRLTSAEKQRFAELDSLNRFLPQHLRRLEPLAMTLRHSFGPPYEPGVPTTYVLERGDWKTPGTPVQAGFPRVFTGNTDPVDFRLDPFKRWPTRGRRKVLADWIASAKHPLTARVIVNRLWQGHFGRGIVSTPSDFGNLGDGPSHPELLDFLACYLTQHDWSLKAVHRLICNSRTYQQVSRVGELPAKAINPSNEWLWAFPSRRLRSEAIRDRILSVSGRLNEEHFGPPIFPPLPDQIEDSVKYNESKWATQYGEEGRKRSIYIYQQRTLSMPLLQVFDGTVCDQSRPQRQSSTTPLQSLAMYNGPLLNTEVPYMVDRIFSLGLADLPSRINAAFQLILARPADPEEIEHFTEYGQTFESERAAIASLARILCNSNEFLYLD
jgi:hypothetical protein